MKTAERILLKSLELFNQQGERNVSSVDIANELDISPGNLYYHFKGKEEIIKALVERYIAQMDGIAPPKDDNIYFYQYLFKCLETMHLFQFLFQNEGDLSVHYPSITQKLQRVAKFQRQYLQSSLRAQQLNHTLSGSEDDIRLLLDIISLILFQSLNYYELRGEALGHPDDEYRTLTTIFFSLQPYYEDAAEAARIKHLLITKTII